MSWKPGSKLTFDLRGGLHNGNIEVGCKIIPIPVAVAHCERVIFTGPIVELVRGTAEVRLDGLLSWGNNQVIATQQELASNARNLSMVEPVAPALPWLDHDVCWALNDSDGKPAGLRRRTGRYWRTGGGSIVGVGLEASQDRLANAKVADGSWLVLVQEGKLLVEPKNVEAPWQDGDRTRMTRGTTVRVPSGGSWHREDGSGSAASDEEIDRSIADGDRVAVRRGGVDV